MALETFQNRLIIRRHGFNASSVDVEGLRRAAEGSKRAKRGRCGGWTYGSYKRLVERLQSVDENDLFSGGFVHAITLTYGHAEGCPSVADVQRHREALMDWAKRQGYDAIHWLVEFQRNGYPHLHLIARCPATPYKAGELVDKWLGLTAANGSKHAGQHVSAMTCYEQYALYLAKHASRQNWHYQRRRLPALWGGYSGRMWGFVGEWRFEAGTEIYMDIGEYWRVRRVARRLLREQLKISRPVWRLGMTTAEFRKRWRQWKRSVVFLRRQFKGLPARLREKERSDWEREEDLHGWFGNEYSHESWCRCWSSSAPISGWVSGRIVKEAIGYG